MRTVKVFVAAITLCICGCSYLREMSSPNLEALTPYGAVTSEDQDERLVFIRRPMSDDELAMAFRYIKSYEPKELSFNGRGITDLSVSLLLQLDSVERLELQGTGISIHGLTHLRLMKNLHVLYVSTSLEPKEMNNLQESLKGIKVEAVPSIIE